MREGGEREERRKERGEEEGKQKAALYLVSSPFMLSTASSSLLISWCTR